MSQTQALNDQPFYEGIKMNHLAFQAAVVTSTSQIQNSLFFKKTLLPRGLINKGISYSNLLPDGFIEAHLQTGDMTGFSTKADTQIISSFHIPLTLIIQLLTPIPKSPEIIP